MIFEISILSVYKIAHYSQQMLTTFEMLSQIYFSHHFYTYKLHPFTSALAPLSHITAKPQLNKLNTRMKKETISFKVFYVFFSY